MIMRYSLLLVGSLLVARSVFAQTEPVARLHEMACELAWASDPATFPCALTATVDGRRLRIAGFVPDVAALERATKLAQHASSLPLEVRLEIDANRRIYRPALPTSKVLIVAEEALRQAMPEEHSRIRVLIRRDGQALLQGNVATRQAQCLATRVLRDVAGITSIRNELEIGSTNAAAPAFAAKGPQSKEPPVVVPIRRLITVQQSKESVVPEIHLVGAKPVAEETSDPPAAPRPEHDPMLPSDLPAVVIANKEPPVAAEPSEADVPDLPPVIIPDPSKLDVAAIIRSKVRFQGDIEVVEGKNARLELHLTVATEEEAERIATAILKLPDFANRDVEIAARIGPGPSGIRE